ncbi:twin-arginine translocase TatA/TatE family subunit [Pontivivens insulae]|uniref:Sec-independent protein translocase protein TatA n=1 Tax=Pontivivens insulae TaxID=1639689 RepID=A0A2R8A9Q7_9RHOB|nr:twin-arginine translocase TatA/TatE family subunit [Pontivivens insulae]RED12851.1 sec-independent protein translocase protein TatA [Pontivivens insulae]SPF28942.1 Sec-independent protein translocase protein TatA [Pontivivens insulae]
MLNNIGPMGFLVIAVVVLVLFGRGKISQLMGDVGKGITSFKRGMAEGAEESKQENLPHAADEVRADVNETAENRSNG